MVPLPLARRTRPRRLVVALLLRGEARQLVLEVGTLVLVSVPGDETPDRVEQASERQVQRVYPFEGALAVEVCPDPLPPLDEEDSGSVGRRPL